MKPKISNKTIEIKIIKMGFLDYLIITRYGIIGHAFTKRGAEKERKRIITIWEALKEIK